MDAVETLKVRARRRLIGASLLVISGLIAFPLLFESKPRPLPLDMTIDIPRKESVAPLVMPAPGLSVVDEAASAPPPKPVAEAAPVAVPAPSALPATAAPAETKTEAKSQTPPEVKAEPKAEPKPEAKVQAKAEPKAEAKAEPKAVAKPEGKAAAKEEAGETSGKSRWVVQAGAYTDPAAARSARAKLEKLGIKTYEQRVQLGDGVKIRVRVGPFKDREEAEKMLPKVRATGLEATVLGL